MDTTINLSYIITTRNRLPFLKITLQQLMDQLQTDEEIVVVDADSTDGTQAYLKSLFVQGKIQQYISEPDRNQAHGWNKAMLMARGNIIKKIIDDDVFCFDAILMCKAYMLAHTAVDVVISNDASGLLNDLNKITKQGRLSQFENWRKGHTKSFTFSDVHMLIRRSALSYLGLYDTRFVMMDWEYSLRISYKKANIAYYTGYNALTVGHHETVTSNVNKAKLKAEGKLGAMLYEYAGDDSEINYWSKFKIAVGKVIYKNKPAEVVKPADDNQLATYYAHYYARLQDLNTQENFDFITNN